MRLADYHPSQLQYWCAVCQKTSEKVIAERDPLSLEWSFVAHCHGETSKTTVYERDLMAGRLEFFQNQAARERTTGDRYIMEMLWEERRINELRIKGE